MGTSLNGPLGEHNGKVGNVIYYRLNNKIISRVNGKNTKPRTIPQLRHQQVMKMCGEFMKTLKEFTNVGFSRAVQGTDKNPFNLAMEYNCKNIVIGNYPDLSISYDKVILSKGSLKPAQNAKVSLTTEGVIFSWDSNPQMPWPESNEQCMLMIYFPETNELITKLFGNSRITGSALLLIPEPLLTKPMETYISFVSEDRKQVSDSVYTGKINH